jgi:hypothetical protein
MTLMHKTTSGQRTDPDERNIKNAVEVGKFCLSAGSSDEGDPNHYQNCERSIPDQGKQQCHLMADTQRNESLMKKYWY